MIIHDLLNDLLKLVEFLHKKKMKQVSSVLQIYLI